MDVASISFCFGLAYRGLQRSAYCTGSLVVGRYTSLYVIEVPGWPSTGIVVTPSAGGGKLAVVKVASALKTVQIKMGIIVYAVKCASAVQESKYV